MARQIVLEITHGLGLEEARRRVAEGIEALARKVPGGGDVATRWPSENELRLDVVTMGNTIAVAAAIEARRVRIALSLPLMLSLAGGAIAVKVRESVERLMADAPAARAAPAVATPATGRLPLFQYWDRAVPPVDVAGWIADFAADNPDLDHHLIDRESATAFIAEQHGARHAAAFAACLHPAMQADYFRLCAMAAGGGLYLDADMQSVQPLASLLAAAPEALIVTWRGLLNNSILFFRAPGHSFVAACLALATRIIEERRFRSVALATGPGVFNAVRYLADPTFRAMVSAMLEQGWEDVSALIGDASDPALAAKVGSTLDRAGWDDLHVLAQLADEIAPDFPTLAADYAAITLIGTAESLAWIGQQPAEYQKAGESWLFCDTDIYSPVLSRP